MRKSSSTDSLTAGILPGGGSASMAASQQQQQQQQQHQYYGSTVVAGLATLHHRGADRYETVNTHDTDSDSVSVVSTGDGMSLRRPAGRQDALFHYASVIPRGPSERPWRLRNHLPRITAIDWVRNYGKSPLPGVPSIGIKATLLADFSAALIIAVMLIPQSMAYSLLAGLPPVYGLYSSLMCLVIYPLFSTAPQLATGPTAMLSMVTFSAVRAVIGENADDDHFLHTCLLVAFLGGAFQATLGALHMGFLVNFLSHPLLTGFTSAAAIIILMSQIPTLLGVSSPRTAIVIDMVLDLIPQLNNINWVTVILAAENIMLLFGQQEIRNFLLRRPSIKHSPKAVIAVKAFPAALVCVLLNIALVVGLNLDTTYGVAVVGAIPSGLPAPVNILARLTLQDVHLIVPYACIVSILGFVEAISIARALMFRNPDNPRLRADQELYGVGFANMVGCFFGSFPITGSFSRTAVNGDVGAKTAATSWMCAGMVVIFLLYLTPSLERLPSVTLASIICVAVFKLIEFAPLKKLWKISRDDFWVFVVAFLSTVGLGMETGIAISCGMAIAFILRRLAFPYWTLLGRTEGTSEYHSLHRDPTAAAIPGISIIRFDAKLFFANADLFHEIIMDLAAGTPRPRFIVVDCAVISRIDASGSHILLELPTQLQRYKCSLILCNGRESLCDTIRLASKHHKYSASDVHLNLDFLTKSVHETVSRLQSSTSDSDRTPRPSFSSEAPDDLGALRAPLTTADRANSQTFNQNYNDDNYSTFDDAATVSSLP